MDSVQFKATGFGYTLKTRTFNHMEILSIAQHKQKLIFDLVVWNVADNLDKKRQLFGSELIRLLDDPVLKVNSW